MNEKETKEVLWGLIGKRVEIYSRLGEHPYVHFRGELEYACGRFTLNLGEYGEEYAYIAFREITNIRDTTIYL